jgi:membrane protease YdiL (CAAX protease family)
VKKRYQYFLLTIAIELVLIVLSFILPVFLTYRISEDLFPGLQFFGIPLIVICLPIISVFLFKQRFASRGDLRWGILFGSIGTVLICICAFIYMGLTFDLPNQD